MSLQSTFGQGLWVLGDFEVQLSKVSLGALVYEKTLLCLLGPGQLLIPGCSGKGGTGDGFCVA